jgi:valyl-tRNA synthetase
MSKQWFVKMKELAKPAIEAVQKDEIKFVPERWKKVYLDWMANLKDWCISRQIWWGHRLPVWQAKRKTKNEKLKTDYYVGDNPPEGYKQVEDVLDTWFSSALWPIAVFLKKNGSNSNLKNQNAKLRKTIDIFGEDAVTEDLDYFYPTSILCTARDIIYLWVARMIFSGLELMGKKPFETVYIHPTLFNIEGKRMSKSLGTGVDPLGLIEKFGADALRFGLTYINTGVQDIRFDEKAILAGQKFANKVWNISRFIMMNLENSKLKTKNSKLQLKTKNDKEILIKLQELTKSTTANLEKFRFGQVAHDLYDFIWHDLADQYLEQSKEQLENPKLKENTQRILLKVLTTSLKLLHPIMPFFTEEIWQNLPQYPGKEKLLITAKWPEKL